ncbi:GntR family transcriptional regulator [Bordetella sp. BOR01]|uniref:GntR family transcriptional regulator n=1 Tax=Bordetella sp. BOR01 TaxID=2854779 RepID=UPI001C43B1B1|nr:GntR family transcriptional regulator [Bordetella sp. BOR01]MBV7484069.1 GntR family transcriptional regulator [Bordetella sp. BOR01]
MNDFLEKIQRIDLLGERVYRQLRSYLWSGNVRWGETLRESILAARLGVSRTPVREALTRLAGEGFLENRGRSFAVPLLTEEDIEEIYHLRVLLETDAVRMAAAAVEQQPSRIKRVQEATEHAKRAVRDGDDEGFISANYDFRAAWLALVQNRRLVAAVELYAGLVRSLQILSLGDRKRQIVVLESMEKICQDMKSGDAEKASQTMLHYLAIARMAMLQSLPAALENQVS